MKIPRSLIQLPKRVIVIVAFRGDINREILVPIGYFYNSLKEYSRICIKDKLSKEVIFEQTTNKDEKKYTQDC